MYIQHEHQLVEYGICLQNNYYESMWEEIIVVEMLRK